MRKRLLIEWITAGRMSRLREPSPEKESGVRRHESPLQLDLLEFFQGFGHLPEPFVHKRENGPRFKIPFAIFVARSDARQEVDALLDFGYRPDVELSRGHGIEHVFPQHQVLHVGLRDHHALRAGKTFDAADIKKTLNLFVYASDGLDIALLIDRAGHRDVLPQR